MKEVEKAATEQRIWDLYQIAKKIEWKEEKNNHACKGQARQPHCIWKNSKMKDWESICVLNRPEPNEQAHIPEADADLEIAVIAI